LILKFCRIFRFSRLGVVSLPCEWSWHLVSVRGSKAKYFSIGFTLEINKSSGNSKYGAANSPGLGKFLSSKCFRQTSICMSAVVGSLYGGATPVAAESPIAQLDSQSKLTTPRHENRKIRHENEIVKANQHPLYV
jgi:hypothetical protein